ncbi:acyltransferase family protein [Dokdonia sp. Asnod1-B02]|uniref:acyltransferase family protein n=1 Tax=Dokdonia sp. Asnod1-B02 TaxID=3160573 RepID=UPI00386691BD
MVKHKNNFDFLRFMLAIFVLITHSFSLKGMEENQEWLTILTNNQVSFSAIGLSGFFTVSGYFIYKSLMRSDTIKDYFKKRVLRIFPGLLVVLILSLLVIPFFYEGKEPLLSNVSYLTYLPNNLSLYGFQGIITGVFNEMPYHSVNGSLWTIQYEFSLYVALIALFFLKSYKKLQLILSILVFIFMIVLYNFNLENIYERQVIQILGFHVLNLGAFFVAGTVLAQVNFDKWKHSVVFLISGLLVVLGIYLGFYKEVKHVLFPICILSLGFVPIKLLQKFSVYGDASYGIYIYGFPIQQILLYYFNPEIGNFIIYSIVISIIMGYTSWHLVEKRALQYK